MSLEITTLTTDTTSTDLKSFAYTNDVNEGPVEGIFYTKKGIDDKLGANSGIATLDSNGKIPVTQLPNSIMQYQGNWGASTNTPTLANGAGNADTAIGDIYKATSAGTVNFGAGSIEFKVGDFVILNSSKIWEKSPAGSENFESIKAALGYTPAKENGTILYHSTPWFTASQSITISADGTYATAAGAQFTTGGNQVGAKLIVNGVERLITTPNPTTTAVYVNAPFPSAMWGQTYTSGNWGLYARTLVHSSNGRVYVGDSGGTFPINIQSNKVESTNIYSGWGQFNGQSSSQYPINITKGQLRTTPADGDIENDGRTLYHTDYNAVRKGFAKEDGTILYHTTAWTTAGTISASGTTVTGTGAAFTTAMAGAKIIAANGEQRIIQSVSGQTCVIDRAFAGSIIGSAFGVYGYFMQIFSDGTVYFYNKNGGQQLRFRPDTGIDFLANIRSTLPIASQSTTIAPISIIAGTKKTIQTSGDFENDGKTLLYTKSGLTRTTIPGVIYTSAGPQVIANTTTEMSLFAPKTASGTVAIAGTTAVTGTSTTFTTTLQSGALITVNGETRIVNTITSDTALTVTSAFTTTASGQTLTYKSNVIRANDFYAGGQIRIKMSGQVSTGSPTTSATLYLKLIKGDGTVTTLATVSEGLANNMVAYYFDKEIVLATRTTGATGTIIHQGRSQLCKSDGTNFSMLPITTSTPITFDSTVDQIIELSFAWTEASTSNTITVSNASIEMLGGVL